MAPTLPPIHHQLLNGAGGPPGEAAVVRWIDPAEYGVVPYYAPTPPEPAPEVFGPPDPLEELGAALARLEAEACAARRFRRRIPLGSRAREDLVSLLTALAEEQARLVARLPDSIRYIHQRPPLAPPADVLLTLAELATLLGKACLEQRRLVKLRSIAAHVHAAGRSTAAS